MNLALTIECKNNIFGVDVVCATNFEASWCTGIYSCQGENFRSF